MTTHNSRCTKNFVSLAFVNLRNNLFFLKQPDGSLSSGESKPTQLPL